MIFKFGPKTFSIPSARLPQIGLPYLKLLTAIRIPIPKALKIGGGRAALMSILVVWIPIMMAPWVVVGPWRMIEQIGRIRRHTG